MKKIIIFLLSSICITSISKACGPDYSPDYEYYNLFMQEIINDPLYYPFLRSESQLFYYGRPYKVKNENIEQWEKYLGIDYGKAEYLVFKASRTDIEKLLSGKKADDPSLEFITSDFVKKHRQSLLYISYSKYLEPYMRISGSSDSWYFYNDDQLSAGDLDYDKVVDVLKKSWKAESENELKLRYGYQLVRLAHYTRRYEESVEFFDNYVEPLDYKPAMYYHALSQKAGAEMGMGYIDDANYNFLKVFVNSKNLKTIAFRSIFLNDYPDLDQLLERSQNMDEVNNVYMLLGYVSFNDPLNEIEKIISSSPDAIQAKVLMARAINQIERTIMPLHFYGASSSDNQYYDKRYPVLTDNIRLLIGRAISLSETAINNPGTKEKDFWAITCSYLYFLDKDFDEAEKYLSMVDPVNEIYKEQKENLSLYIYISRLERITPEVEQYIYTKYPSIRTDPEPSEYYDSYYYGVHNFINDLLANRYYIQDDDAKSFLMSNSLYSIENNPDMKLINSLQEFYHKNDKNDYEKYIARKFITNNNSITDIESYFNYLKGIVKLSEGNIEEAYKNFSAMLPDQQYGDISNYVFGSNIMECFDCDEEIVMEMAYLKEFPFIKKNDNMNFRELTEILLKLLKEGQKNGETAARANYLLGNFFYNTNITGYYRNILRFNYSNGYSHKYYNPPENVIHDDIYYKYYEPYYKNSLEYSIEYLEKSLKQAKNDELRAMVIFALSKCELADYNNNNNIYYSYWNNNDNLLISERKYFKELMDYSHTAFFDDVESYCKYFNYYVNKINND